MILLFMKSQKIMSAIKKKFAGDHTETVETLLFIKYSLNQIETIFEDPVFTDRRLKSEKMIKMSFSE